MVLLNFNVFLVNGLANIDFTIWGMFLVSLELFIMK